VWAVAGLVVTGGAVAFLVTHRSRGQTHRGVQSAQCGLVPCADVPSAAASIRSGHRPGTTRSRPGARHFPQAVGDVSRGPPVGWQAALLAAVFW
jgi:hypothetical protein